MKSYYKSLTLPPADVPKPAGWIWIPRDTLSTAD